MALISKYLYFLQRYSFFLKSKNFIYNFRLKYKIHSVILGTYSPFAVNKMYTHSTIV